MNVSSAYTPDSSFVNPGVAGNGTATGRQQNHNAARQPGTTTFASNPTPAATVNFSPESRARQSQSGDKAESASTPAANSDKSESSTKLRNSEDNNEDNKNSVNELSEDEKRQVNELKKRDAEVKAHEQAHIAAGGAYVSGGASYEYEQGPDHQSYAVGGEVSIDTSAENTPEATIRKMQVVKRAALAPMKPSGQDRSVAAQAAQAEARARIELRQQRTEEAAEKKEKSAENSAADPISNNQSDAEIRTEENSANPANDRQTQNPQAGSQLSRAAQTAYQSAEISFTPFNPGQNSPSYNAFA